MALAPPRGRSRRAACFRSALVASVMVLLAFLAGCSGATLQGEWVYLGHPDDPDLATREPRPDAAVKILTDDHFAFGSQSGNGVAAGGGRWWMDDGAYVEAVEYHWLPGFVGAEIRFEWTIDDDLWFHRGTFDRNGRAHRIEEVWRRLEPESDR